MEDHHYEALRQMILRARQLTEQDSQPWWTRNARIHVRQSHLIRLLRKHPSLEVVEDAGLSGGRIRIVNPEDDAPLLLKSRQSVTSPPAIAAIETQSQQAKPPTALERSANAQPRTAGIQYQLPGLEAGIGRPDAQSQAGTSEPQRVVEEADEPDRLLTYEVTGETDVAFSLGTSRRVRYVGGTEDQVEGDLQDVWDSRTQRVHEGFDQAESEDWTEYLNDPGEPRERASE